MAQSFDVRHSFNNVDRASVHTSTLKTAIKNKIKQIQAKLIEREARVAELMKSYKITQAALADLIQQHAAAASRNSISNASYSTRVAASGSDDQQRYEEVVVPAGVVANILVERQTRDDERRQIDDLIVLYSSTADTVDEVVNGVLVRHDAVHVLTTDERRYLGLVMSLDEILA